MNPHLLCTVADSAPTVAAVASADLPTWIGPFRIVGYKSLVSRDEFVVLRAGELRPDIDTLVRIHSQCLTGETFGSLRCDCAAQMSSAMGMIAREGRGAIVYQFDEGRGIGILNKIRAYALQDEGTDTVDANQKLGFASDLRSFGQCAEILRCLNLHRVRLISNNPDKLRVLRKEGFDIVERVSPAIDHPPEALRYLKTKKEKLGHLFETLPASDPARTIAHRIRQRRSIISFSERNVEPDVIRSLLDAGRWAGSSFNEQPWRFLVALRRDHADAFKRMLGFLAAHDRVWAKSASALILATAKRPDDGDSSRSRRAFFDVGQATADIALHAAALGLQMHHVGGFDADAVRASFAIPGEHLPVAMFAIGYPGEAVPAADRQRKPLEALVYWGGWSDGTASG
jgi:3,4-dihydroxy 2-butanone 4-phosphate synthase/GTP cyclohydrolase II